MDSQIKSTTFEDTSALEKKKRRTYPFPTLSFVDSLVIAHGIWKFASGQKIRRLTLFDHLGKSPESGPSRTLVTASSKYGITLGGSQADYIELTEDGRKATNPDEAQAVRTKTKFKLAIGNNEYFSKLYEQYKGMKLPSKSVMNDFLQEQGLNAAECASCIELFIVNSTYIGILKVMAGAERILTIEQILEEIDIHPNTQNDITYTVPIVPAPIVIHSEFIEKPFPTTDMPTPTSLTSPDENSMTDAKWEKICFFIAPIGEENSDERKHSDLFLSSIVEPALDEFGFKVVRADSISTPGMITTQIIEYIIESKLVIADLSFHNPNVFYELSLRHASKKATIHLIQKSDKIPFDLNDFRAIVIDTSSIYTLVPKLQTYQTEIAMQVRQLLHNPTIVDNPISAYLERTGKKIIKC
jgi:hypothetical protein